MFKKIYSLKQKMIECRYRCEMSTRVITVYMFHRVTNNMCAEYENITITPNGFEKFLAGKMEEGWKFIPLEQLENEESFGKRVAVITFDDMFEDAYVHAIPILRKQNIPYTVFIAAGLIGKPNYITDEELADLRRDELCTIGAHSLSHRVLRKLPMEQKELELDKEKFEQMLKQEVHYFAYPYGSCYACDGKSQQIVSQEYKYGFSTLGFSVSYKYLKRRPEFLPRINVNNRNYSKV